MNRRHHWILALALFSLAPSAAGHSAREDYLIIDISNEGAVTGRFELHAKDLKAALGVEIAVAEGGTADTESARESASKVHDYIRSHYELKADGQLIEPVFTEIAFVNEVGTFVQYFFEASLSRVPSQLSFRHDMFYEADAQHRGLLVLTTNPITGEDLGEMNVAVIFSKSKRRAELSLRAPIDNLLTPRGFVRTGFLIALTDPDRVLFLIVLLLPLALRREGDRFASVATWRQAGLNVIVLIGLFALAHGLALGLGAKGIISPPIKLVGSLLAITLLLAALSNLYPRTRPAAPVFVPIFGFCHGLASAADFARLPYRLENIKEVFLKFTLGLELAHLAVAIPVFLLLMGSRTSSRYQPLLLRGISALTMMAGAYWLVVRAFESGT